MNPALILLCVLFPLRDARSTVYTLTDSLDLDQALDAVTPAGLSLFIHAVSIAPPLVGGSCSFPNQGGVNAHRECSRGINKLNYLTSKISLCREHFSLFFPSGTV